MKSKGIFLFLFGICISAKATEMPPPSALPCSFTINPGQDITICNPGQTVSLGTSVTGPYLSAMWSPSTGLSNPNSPSTNATVTQTTTYTLTVSGLGSTNLVVNGDFNAGLSGFSSNYVPGTGGPWGVLSNEGTFAVATNPNLTHTAFANCSDHTGGGNMLVVNGAGVPNQNVWCQTVNVMPNTNYAFIAWGASVVSSSPAVLQISINGGLLGSPFTLPAATCQWTQFFQQWNSGASTTATICIVNQNTQPSGNDFALDDLFFGPLCEESVQVTVNVQNVNAAWTPPQNLCTLSPPFDLNGLLSPSATPGGAWTINGTPGSFFYPGTLGPGTHSVTYSVGAPPCTQTLTLPIAVNPLPSASWSPPPALCANNPAFSLNILLLPGAQSGGQWTVNGMPATSFQPAVLGPGSHLVEYTAGTPPCVNSFAQVIQVLPLPNASWTPPPPVCAGSPPFPLQNLLVPGATPGGSWTVVGVPAVLFDPGALPTGQHWVTYTAGSAGCSSAFSDAITILPRPTASFTAPAAICISDTAWVTFTGSAIPGATFQWNFAGAAVAAGSGAGPYGLLWPSPGSRRLSLVVEQNGCRSDTFAIDVRVDAALTPPVIQCVRTESSVAFIWQTVPGATGYQISAADGRPFTTTSDTSVLFENLAPGEVAEIWVTATGNGVCPAAQASASCTASACPVISVSILPIDTICWDGMPETFALEALISGDTASGQLTWSGPGMVDPQAGIWQSQAGMVGQAVALTAVFSVQSCAYTDTLLVPVFARPESTIAYDAELCQNEPGEIRYGGPSLTGAVFLWDFGAGTATPGTGPGPHSLSFDGPGTYPVSLTVTANGCTSPLTEIEMEVYPALDPPLIQCEATYTTVLFTWSLPANAYTTNASIPGGQPGTMPSDTSFLVTGLAPGEAVSIQVEASGHMACPAVTASAVCSALPCPDVTLSIVQPPAVCHADTLQLALQLTGAPPSGNLHWQGEGIIDTDEGIWTSNAGMIGRSIWVKAVFADDVCVFSDSAAIPVFAVPDVVLEFDSLICISESAAIRYAGNAGADANYNWHAPGATLTTGNGPGPHSLHYAAPGEYFVALRVEENGCTGLPDTARIRVDATPESPAIRCEATYTGVTFSWAPGAHVAHYTAQESGGLLGMMLSDTAFFVGGLMPGQAVEIELTAHSAGVCPDVVAVAGCTALSCSDVSLALIPPAQICWDGQADTLQLALQLTGAPASGNLHWQGEGIIDTNNGIWAGNAGMIGRSIWVKAVFADDVCVFSDSAAIPVFATPDVVLEFDSLICISESAGIQYAGNAGADANYNWHAPGATLTTGNGPGPHSLHYAAPGEYFVALRVEENGCMGLPDTARIRVDALLEPPLIRCEATHTSITFYWDQVAGADAYEVDISPGVVPVWTLPTRFVVNDLSPGDSVQVMIEALSVTACPGSTGFAACGTLPCVPLALTMQGPSVVCAGDSVRVRFGIDGPAGTALDIVLSDGVGQWNINGLQQGYSWAFQPAQSGALQVTSAVDAQLAACPVSIPAPLNYSVERVRNAGMPASAFELCAFSDTLVLLHALLEDADTGGAWSLAPGSAAPAAGTFQPLSGIFNPAQNGAGAYLFQYAVAAGAACPADTATTAVRLLPLPPADAGPDRTLDCLNRVASIGRAGSANLRYRWSTTGGNLLDDDMPMVEVDMPGIYRLDVADQATGCRAFDEVRVLSEIAVLDPVISVQQISCFGANDGFIHITSVSGGTAPLLFSMNGAAFSSQTAYANLPPGGYNLRIRDAAGCESELRFQLPEPALVEAVLDPPGLSTDNTAIQLGDSLRLQVLTNIPPGEIAFVQWSPQLCTGCTAVSIRPAYSATYAVTVTNTNGCSASARLAVTVDRRPAVFVPNAFSPNNDGLNDVLTVFAGKQVEYIRAFVLFDRWGEAVFEVYDFPPNDPAYSWDGTHRGRRLSPAVFVYFLEVVTIDGEVHLLKGDVTLLK